MATTRTPEVATPTKNQRAISKFVNELGVLDQKGYAGVLGGDGLASQVAEIFRKLGDGVTAWIPGVGLVNGLQAGNYLDSAGTTAATVDNPVGLGLDGAGSVGGELVTTQDLTNAQWAQLPATPASTTTANTLTFGGQYSGRADVITTVSGKWYKFTFEARRISGNTSLRIFCDVVQDNNGASDFTVGSEWQQYTRHYWAKTTVIDFGWQDRNASGHGTIELRNISVKEVTGIHALQATTANKPILRRGAVNLLTYSEQFDNVAWGKANVTVTANAIIAPNGTLTADKLIRNNGAGGAYLTRDLTVSIGNGQGTVDLTTGVVSGLVSWTTSNLSSTIDANGFVRIRLSGNGYTESFYAKAAEISSLSVQISGTSIYIYPYITGTGDGTSGIYIWGAQLQTGSVATDYIPTTTAAASSATGNYHWVADSTDLLTATYPAGYESATVINIAPTGQFTETAQNIVGSYNVANAVVGSELVTNGMFDSNITGWDSHSSFLFDTFEWVAGRLHCVSDGSSRCIGGQAAASAFPVVLGKAYLVEFTVTVVSGYCGAFRLNQTYYQQVVDNGHLLISSGVGTYTVSKIVLPTVTTNAHFTCDLSKGAAGEFYIDEVSIKEVSLDSYGKFTFKDALTASELTTMQTFANRLAGV